MTYVHMDSSTITGMKYKGKRYTVGKPTDLSNYYTKSQTDSAINTAIIIAKSDID